MRHRLERGRRSAVTGVGDWRRRDVGASSTKYAAHAASSSSRVIDRLDAAIPAQRRDLIEQVARVARAQRPAERRVVPPLQIRDHHLMEPQIAAAAVQLEDPA